MIVTGCNFRSTNVKKIKTVEGIKFFFLFVSVVVSAVIMTGCSSAKGRDLAPRDDILKTLRTEGFLFNKYVISTLFGEHQNQVIVSGRLARKTPDNRHVPNGFKITQYKNVVVENVKGTWEIVSAQQVQRNQLTSRQRW